MNARSLLFSRFPEPGTKCPSSQHESSPVAHELPKGATPCEIAPQGEVGEGRLSEGRLSDSERESAIKRAGDALIAAYSRKEAARRRYDTSSCLTDKADMDAADLQAREALRLMEALIRGRSAAMVARMERERGLNA